LGTGLKARLCLSFRNQLSKLIIGSQAKPGNQKKNDLIPPHPNPLPHWGRGDKEPTLGMPLSPQRGRGLG